MCDYLNPCKRIWEGYKTYAKSASVIRKGFELVGASVNTDDSLDFASTFYRRSESTLEHQAKTAWLASALATDIWGAQMSNQVKSYPSHISEPVLTLLNVAARDIRNEEFSWLQESS